MHQLHLILLLLFLLFLHLLLLLQVESMSLLISDLLQLFALAWEEKNFLALHFALLSDHLSLNVNREALYSTFHGVCLLSNSVILNLLSLFDDMLITLATLINWRLEFAFFLELFLFFIALVPDSIVDLVSPDLISLEKGSTLSVLVREIIIACCRHHGFEGAFLHLLDLAREACLEDLGLLGLVPRQSSLIKMLRDGKGRCWGWWHLLIVKFLGLVEAKDQTWILLLHLLPMKLVHNLIISLLILTVALRKALLLVFVIMLWLPTTTCRLLLFATGVKILVLLLLFLVLQ